MAGPGVRRADAVLCTMEYLPHSTMCSRYGVVLRGPSFPKPPLDSVPYLGWEGEGGCEGDGERGGREGGREAGTSRERGRAQITVSFENDGACSRAFFEGDDTARSVRRDWPYYSCLRVRLRTDYSALAHTQDSVQSYSDVYQYHSVHLRWESVVWQLGCRGTLCPTTHLRHDL